MHSVKELQQKVEQHIASLTFPDQPNHLYEPISYILSIGGKRIRPVLTLLATEMFGGKIDQSALDVAIGLEVFHNFTLLHDDILDKAPLRRNQPTVHTRWNEGIALLSGDAMLIVAFRLISQCPSKKLSLIINHFSDTAVEVCEGQQYDMDFESLQAVSIAQYLEMIRLKTSVLLGCCLKTGALLASSSNEKSELIYQFGINIGLAFQLQDDLLDTFGDQEVFGKMIGGDIVAGKKTFLLIQALEKLDTDSRNKLLQLIKSKDITDEIKINKVKDLYEQLQIKHITQNKIEAYFTTASKCLEKINLPFERKQILKEFIEKLTERTS